MTRAGTALGKTTLQLPLLLSGGETAKLSDYAGQWLVLYFYPKDSTPGCTTEGIDFNGLLP
ncbi:MAG: redoxin domain-containing protein, partial [Pseudoxanthomonas sp.]